MEKGFVKHLVLERGFGFIENQGVDIFFHFRDLDGLAFNEQLMARDVIFELKSVGGRNRAVNVRADI